MEGAGGEDSLAHTRAHVPEAARSRTHAHVWGTEGRAGKGPEQRRQQSPRAHGSHRVVVQEGDES